MGGVVWLSVMSFGRRRHDRSEPTLGGTSSGNRRQDWQGEIDHGGKEELGSQREGAEPGTAGPRDPRLPWWIPDPAEGGVALELQEAITQSAHRGEAPGVERRAGTEVAGAETEADTAAVAEKLRGVDQGWPAKAGTPTSEAVAEKSTGVDQRQGGG